MLGVSLTEFWHYIIPALLVGVAMILLLDHYWEE